jgi:hypothetical protein
MGLIAEVAGRFRRHRPTTVAAERWLGFLQRRLRLADIAQKILRIQMFDLAPVDDIQIRVLSIKPQCGFERPIILT